MEHTCKVLRHKGPNGLPTYSIMFDSQLMGQRIAASEADIERAQDCANTIALALTCYFETVLHYQVTVITCQ